MKTNSIKLLDNVSLAGTTPITSIILPMDRVYCFGLQSIVSGASIAGSFQMFVSCEQGRDEQGAGVTAWAPLDSATTLTTAGSSIINKDGIGYRWFKVVFTPASGTGNLTLIINTKGA